MWHEMCRRQRRKGSEWWNEEVGKAVAENMVKDINGQILLDGVDVRRRWAEYF